MNKDDDDDNHDGDDDDNDDDDGDDDDDDDDMKNTLKGPYKHLTNIRSTKTVERMLGKCWTNVERSV